MHFKNWLINEANKSEADSWLDTSGRFFPLEAGVNHYEWAYRHKGLNTNGLWQKGWMRVFYIADKLYTCNYEGIVPNNRQTRELIDFCIDSRKFNQLIYDNGNKDIIIWEKDR